jgi:prepilin-type N-terminal cleavage/methylation domain-containing protein
MKRAFSLIEVMIVVAIAGILASVAVPSFRSMAEHYRSAEASRAALAAVTAARALAQRRNTPVELTVFSDKVVLSVPVFAEAPESIRKNVTSFNEQRTIALPRDVTVERLELLDDANVVSATRTPGAAAKLVFCATSDSYYRNSADQKPLCSAGNITSSRARIVLKGLDHAYRIEVSAALGTVELKGGAS